MSMRFQVKIGYKNTETGKVFVLQEKIFEARTIRGAKSIASRLMQKTKQMEKFNGWTSWSSHFDRDGDMVSNKSSDINKYHVCESIGFIELTWVNMEEIQSKLF